MTHYNFLGQNMAAEITDDSLAVMFMVQMDTPGIKLICRPSYELVRRCYRLSVRLSPEQSVRRKRFDFHLR